MKNIFLKLFGNQQARGKEAESYAVYYLRKQGLRLIARNYCCRFGEIDIIVCDGKYLIFVEVRLRNNLQFATPLESVDYFKRQRIIKAAKHFLYSKRLGDKLQCRFDVIGIQEIAGKFKLQWVKDAFQDEF